MNKLCPINEKLLLPMIAYSMSGFTPCIRRHKLSQVKPVVLINMLCSEGNTKDDSESSTNKNKALLYFTSMKSSSVARIIRGVLSLWVKTMEPKLETTPLYGPPSNTGACRLLGTTWIVTVVVANWRPLMVCAACKKALGFVGCSNCWRYKM